MQHGFLQKVVLSMIIGAVAAGFVEFYKNFVEGADNALNGKHKPVHMASPPPGTSALKSEGKSKDSETPPSMIRPFVSAFCLLPS